MHRNPSDLTAPPLKKSTPLSDSEESALKLIAKRIANFGHSYRIATLRNLKRVKNMHKTLDLELPSNDILKLAVSSDTNYNNYINDHPKLALAYELLKTEYNKANEILDNCGITPKQRKELSHARSAKSNQAKRERRLRGVARTQELKAKKDITTENKPVPPTAFRFFSPAPRQTGPLNPSDIHVLRDSLPDAQPIMAPVAPPEERLTSPQLISVDASLSNPEDKKSSSSVPDGIVKRQPDSLYTFFATQPFFPTQREYNERLFQIAFGNNKPPSPFK